MAPRQSKEEKEFIALNEAYDDLIDSYEKLKELHPGVVNKLEELLDYKTELQTQIADMGKELFLKNPDADWLRKFSGKRHFMDFSVRQAFNMDKCLALGIDPDQHPGVFKKKWTATISAAKIAAAEGLFGELNERVLECIEPSGASCTFREGTRE